LNQQFLPLNAKTGRLRARNHAIDLAGEKAKKFELDA
jgi:hypothetical protein